MDRIERSNLRKNRQGINKYFIQKYTICKVIDMVNKYYTDRGVLIITGIHALLKVNG